MKKDTKRLAALFRRAAEIMADPRRCHYGCCRAIELALAGPKGYSTPEHDVFKDAFSWIHNPDYIEHWHSGNGVEYPEERREARVLALLFCADMIEAGDL